jgi:hypothetical protein
VTEEFKMRDATLEEQEAVDRYIKSISKPTGINVFDFYEDEEKSCNNCKHHLKFMCKKWETCHDYSDWELDELDFIQPKKSISCTIKVTDGDAISRHAVDVLVDELARTISDERCCMSRGRSTATIMQDILDLPSVKPQELNFCRSCKHYNDNEVCTECEFEGITRGMTRYESVLQESKTGHWIIDERPESNREIICSNCEQPIFKYHKMDFDYRPNYCPNCGAKMRRVSKWSFNNAFFRAKFNCDICDKKYKVSLRYKQYYDYVDFKKKVEELVEKKDSE